MSFLRGSANYVWCTTSVLGKGATGAVFQGVNKNNGEPVAVKTFNQVSHMRPHDVQMREFEVLRKVKHENIVKLLAIEEEQDGRGKVIVMELCTGGSLFNILDDPENTYGLAEEEFLLVLEHLSAGMKHLRDNNLVHRDLKPGNIMKFIADDGSTIYKLTDFGAARELQEDQQFVSLYGTEEYLHPDMYERAVLRKPVDKSFGATVDLWSIGVTLYHVATGQLPFRPHGGRRNRETMFYITTKKASGVIAGAQMTENGPIDWSRELPHSCRLSAGLRRYVTPLLAGLLEVDRQKIWSFDRFFSRVTDTLCRRPAINIFDVHGGNLIKIYLHPEEERFAAFQAHIHDQTSIPARSQILLKGQISILQLVEISTPGKGYPLTSVDEPLHLFSRENNNVMVPLDSELPKFPIFANLVSVEIDASQAKSACSVGHECKRRIDKIARCSKLSQDAVTSFVNYLVTELGRALEKCQRAKDFTKAVEDLAIAIERGEAIAKQVFLGIRINQGSSSSTSVLSTSPTGSNLSSATQNSVVPSFEVKSWKKELDVKSNELFGELAPAISQLHQRYVKENCLRSEWDTNTRGLWCPWASKASQKAATLVDRLRDGWQHLLRDRATRSLTYNDEQFHVLERIKVTETGRRMKDLLEKQVIPAITQHSECLADWYKMAQTVFLQTQILDKDIDNYNRMLESFSLSLSQEGKERYDHICRSIDSWLPRMSQQSSKTMNESESEVNELRKRRAIMEEGKWKDICSMQKQILMVLYKNNKLVDELNNWTLNEMASTSSTEELHLLTMGN
ncbi:PREDICTED: inhibitor of nuclear factor kappa-B kinase subunit epsilon [Ceratosolen solmsi marchali]|uniref:Inhibitor of nuclear factor kappa-B kinase subunit epsilon n=1 Tax=Ceratosolen solmsi marchali TaxID=326594 RepID=A0AAJ6YBE0_9HYME|nr:PREDICTED: inhibitor of nuclear factor kappa-B kinase subunit epsilon [Ceratosolen solmsi marchali]XP_011494024.1 PREDICTED: inhibitor of nuclear factor kappa-B kinase subunit epsilon [Ceratosolen solmsi marchali]XP_011494025.1 PREDICTED: inhibitor of nuclear factor kappa-B kinase subunit epsilon [Ceratosolen solmsi marchali]